MNSMQIKAKLKNIADKKDVSINLVIKSYIFERFICRLSISKYNNNFILKGGWLLSTLFGIENRSTMDIDSVITKTNFTEENIVKMINSIVNIDLNDNVEFIINNIEKIKEEDEYGGYRINLLFKLENIRDSLQIDIATGDSITPKEIIFKYKMLLDNTYINIWSYNLETILAEKIETILSKIELNSRMKDYYDIYLIYKLSWDSINYNILKKAIDNTFTKRDFNENIYEMFNIVKKSTIIRDRWVIYSKKYSYANNISYEEIINCIEKIINIIEPVIA